MSQTVFFSWQSDTDSKIGRNFIEEALKRAVKEINSDLEVKDADRQEAPQLKVDKDTKGVPGSPSIVDTILRKIDNALCFVGDLTFVANRTNGGGVPNPNVMIEYGYALKALGDTRVISVMNAAFGDPRKVNLPFDLAHKLFPTVYTYSTEIAKEDRDKEFNNLVQTLKAKLRAVLDHHREIVPVTKPEAFPAKAPMLGKARFRPHISEGDHRTEIGLTESRFDAKPRKLHLEDGPAMYLRLLPTQAQNKKWTLPELKRNESGQQGIVLTPMNNWSSGRFHAEDGIGWYSGGQEHSSGPVISNSIVIAFTTGEIWSIDTCNLDAWNGTLWLNQIVSSFAQGLEKYSSYLQSLGIEPPYTWIAGLEGIDGRYLDWATPQGQQRLASYIQQHPCLTNSIEVQGTYAKGQSAKDALRPFFEELCNKCVVEPPRHIIPAEVPQES